MPLYEYVCRDCGNRFEKMRPVAERLSAPDCPACAGQRAALAMSAPGRVGAGAASRTTAGGETAGSGGCCGGACGCGGH